MECGNCIFERFSGQGSWDRFGTTEEQEVEAICNKHLLKAFDYAKKYGESYSPNWRILVEKEIKKRVLAETFTPG